MKIRPRSGFPLRFSALLLVSIPLSGPAGGADQLLTVSSAWDYLHPLDGVSPVSSDDDFDSTWMTGEAYDGPAFTKGKPGPFSYGGISYFQSNNLTGTFIGTGADGSTAPESGLRYTAYFTTTFTAAEVYAQTIATMLVDDGAVIYMDGTEVARVNMSGPVNGAGDYYEMMADNATGTETAPLVTMNLGPVSAGTHLLAVSVHNADTTSSDLGFSMELAGLKPVILRSDFAGKLTEIGPGEAYTGWKPRSSGCWQLNAPDAASHDLQSAPVDLSAVGTAYFSMELFCHETSTGSNFEDNDVFGAKLLAVLDDNTSSQIPLIPASMDANGDGVLSGAEFDPDGAPVNAFVVFGRQLTAVIPANVKSVSLLVTGQNDSSSEFFAVGGALISDQPPGVDHDGDGISREAEMQAGTDPADPASALKITEATMTLNPATSNYEFSVTLPAIAGREYGFEQAVTANGSLFWTYLGSLTPTSSGDFAAYLDLGPLPDPSLLLRVRCMP